ncbi:MAG: serine/threonine protein kinase [Myxococcaceae bacterium]|nr:serine/threonine protein kinase [Myxococcaceae bacterium]
MSGDVQVGDRLGPYRLDRVVGEGSMGRVFLAVHLKLGRRVAIKMLRPEHAANGTVVSRFFDEARAVNRINHEHIIEIHDFVEDGPHCYCVMEHLDGMSLADTAEAAPLPVQAIITVMQQLCSALGAAHEVGVVHRDVKPENVILLRRPGAPLFVKVLDFGVAKLGADLRRTPVSQTAQGTLLGTPLFMAPEQIVGLEVDRRADVWAVGCLLYWLLAGRLPFNSPHFGQLSMQVIKEAPPPLPSRTPGGERVPAGLADLALRCLAKSPEDRPSSMHEVRVALDRPDAPWRRRLPEMARLKVAAIAAALLAAAAAWSYGWKEPAPAATAVDAVAQPKSQQEPQRARERVVPLDVDDTIDPFAR